MAEASVKREGWTRVAFGEVVRLTKKRSRDPEAEGFERYIGLDHLDPGELNIRRWGDVSDGTTFTSIFVPGQVLFGKRRAYQRKVGVASFSGVCSGDIYVFEPDDPNVLLPELLPFVCQSEGFFRHAIGTSAGSLSPRTNWSSLATYEFALPPSREQRRIVEGLLAMEEVTDKLRHTSEMLTHTELAVFDSVVDGGTSPVIELHDLLVESPRNGYSPAERSEPTGHWVLALSAITPWGYQPGELKAVDPAPEVLGARLHRGDLVVSRSNTPDLVGLPAIFEEERDDVSRPDTMMLLRPDKTRVRSRFLELFLRSPLGRQQVRSYAAGTSASMKKINGSNLQKIQVPVPSLPEQARIVEATRDVRHCRQITLRRVDKMRGLKASFLTETIG